MSVTDAITQRWIRNPSDSKAVANDCRFNEDRGRHAIAFLRRFIRLYEGEWAGQPLEPMPWQEDVLMRLFGWVRPSQRWKREVRRFRQASIWVPKKNGKTPLLAAVSLYLLCADGEQGNHVYLAATDGTQARELAGKHVLEMVLASPELQAETEINRSLLQVTHRPSRSNLKPISSSDSRSQKSKEGLNGSVCIDETHVVDRAFMQRISRAGISRSEPLLIEVSTAGNDPEGYGKERYDWGKRVEAGLVEDEQLFFVSHEAPQELSDEELGADPLRWGKLANPGWSVTIDPDEYLADYQRSKASLTTLADFKMYRLNIWQKSANPWLRASDWEKCRREFTEEDLRGSPCWAGLDLSRTRDLTALSLVFPWEDGAFRRLVYFWMPEETAKDRGDRAPFLQWARDGWITLTPGNTIDYGFIRKRFRELAQQFDIRELRYDPWQAEETTQAIEQGVVVDGQEIEQGTGVPRVEFRQTIANFAGATDEYEKLVIEGKLHHNGNPVLTWQAGHVAVIRDANDNKRPVKPNRNDPVRTIDGIVADVMAQSGATQGAGDGPSVYETPGSLAL